MAPRAVTRGAFPAAAALLGLSLAVPAPALPPVSAPDPAPVAAATAGGCAPALDDTSPPAYYAIPLVSTRRVPGTGEASGVAQESFTRSPFGVSLAPDGRYVHDLRLQLNRLPPPSRAAYVVWVATPQIDQVRLLGVLDDGMQLNAKVEWNKFILVITLEPAAAQLSATWQGPVVLRGMSRSGRMHTMAGHGAFRSEPCAKYGYE